MDQPNYYFSWADEEQRRRAGEPVLPRNGDPEYPPDPKDHSPYTAEDALRAISFYLGTGGYNSDQFDAEDFEKRIRSGIDGLTRPLEDRIANLLKPRVEVWMLLPQDREDIDYYTLWHQGDTHIGPIWGLSPNDVEGKAFSDGAIEAIRDLNPSDVPANAFAIKFLMTDLEWETGDTSCGLPAGWMMKAEVIGYDFLPTEEHD